MMTGMIEASSVGSGVQMISCDNTRPVQPVSGLDGQWRLDEVACLHFAGSEARAFLHAQLTQAVLDLEPGRARAAAYCTAQGRVLASGVLWALGPDELRFMVSSDLAADLQQRMQRYVMRADVRIALEEGGQVAGMRGAEHVPERLHSAPPWTVQADDAGCWISGPGSSTASPWAWHVAAASAAPSAAGPTDGAAGWQAGRLLAGWPLVRAATQGMFLPASLNMDLNGTIHFQKGCYPGQEIIARSHYRGTVKRRLATGHGPWPGTGAGPAAGSDLFEPAGSGRPVARLIEACVWHGHVYAAVEALVADGPELQLASGSAQGPILAVRMA